MALEQLLATLTDTVAVTEGERLRELSADRAPSVAPGAALAALLPGNEADVVSIIAWANATGTPVVTRGLGSGEAGGATALDGCVVLSTERLNRIVSVSPEDQVAVVEAGVKGSDLNSAAAVYGLRYLPDPGSLDISTLGGNIATNAGGFQCAKYGTTGTAVLGLRVVTGAGDVLDLGHSTLKGVAGLNLAQLFVGSEGILGIITQATVRLAPVLSDPPVTAAAYFPDFASAVAASIAVSNSGLAPAFVEAIDENTLAGIDTLRGLELTRHGRCALLVQLDVSGGTHAPELEALLSEHGAGHVEMRVGTEGSDELLFVRRSALPSSEAKGDVLSDDVAVPRSRLVEMVRRLQEIGQRHGVRIETVAHAADGNLHPTIVYQTGDDISEVQAAAQEVMAAAVQLGGTITGEHGVGLLKQPALRDELGELVAQYSVQVKRVFDPAGVLNPGKSI